MTPEEQRIAIAEACGWTLTDNKLHGCLPNTTQLQSIPWYLDDLNAMHEAESQLKPTQWRLYSDKLMVLIRDSDLLLNGSNIEARYKTPYATAQQRAEAFLRTIGKWKD